jgi:hypothetical protein
MRTQLALAIAQGRSVALWARDNHVPRSTAYRWASQSEVRSTVESCRRRARDRALGRMAMRAQRECEQIVKLAACAKSESVKLRALRAILAGVISRAKFSDLRRRMAAIEQELHERRESVVHSDAMFTSGQTLENPKKAPLCLIFSQAQDAFSGGDRAPHLVSPSRHSIGKARFRRAKKRRGARAPANARQILPVFTIRSENMVSARVDRRQTSLGAQMYACCPLHKPFGPVWPSQRRRCGIAILTCGGSGI